MNIQEQNNNLKSYYLKQLQKGNIRQETYDKIIDWIERQDDWKNFPKYNVKESSHEKI